MVLKGMLKYIWVVSSSIVSGGITLATNITKIVKYTKAGHSTCAAAWRICQNADASAPDKPKPGSLATVSDIHWTEFITSTLVICGIAMSSGSFYVSFLCAAGFFIAMRLAYIQGPEV